MTTQRILVVDEDQALLDAVEKHLAGSDLEVRAVREPMRVVPEARTWSPSLILMERSLPVLTGGEVIRALRAFPETADIPVAFAVADASDRELIRCIVAGAVDVIAKPFSAAHGARVRALLDELSQEPTDPSGAPADARHFLDCARRTQRHGTLVVNRGTPFEGRVVFERGKLLKAEYGPLHGAEAISELLALEDAVFELDASIEDPKPKPVLSPAEMILPTSVTPLPTDPAQMKPRLLVVDDEPHLRALFSAQLNKGGFEVETAEDGEEAVARALATPFDLILADLSMPRMDGWAMLRILKRDHRTREVPVIFLSAHDDYRETLKAAKAGAHDYLPKTGRSEHVLKSVSQVIAPRLEALFELIVNQPMKVRGHLIGVQWFLRSLTRMRSTGVLELDDEWGHYRCGVRDGQPAWATAQTSSRKVEGVGAFAAMLVAPKPQGTFTPGTLHDDSERLPLSMENLLQRTCEQLNQLEAQLTADRLATTTLFDVDAELYALYRQIAPERRIELARAVCERGVAPAQLVEALQLTPEEVAEGLTDLLRRGVIRLR